MIGDITRRMKRNKANGVRFEHEAAKVLGTERYATKVDRRPDPEACWEWMAARSRSGYGVFWLDGKLRYAHRVSYESINGSIPDGLQLDHLCRNRACVNPDHLEPVSNRENAIRGLTGSASGARQRAKTHCPQGHLYDEKNTCQKLDGRRACRTCGRLAQRRRSEAKRCSQ